MSGKVEKWGNLVKDCWKWRKMADFYVFAAPGAENSIKQ